MHWVEIICTVIGSVAASSGFWAWMQAHRDKRDAKTQMILGLGHDRIIYLCEKYIDRGWISTEEFENLETYLFTPYENMGGNGSAKRLMGIVRNLPTKKVTYTADGKRIESEIEPRNEK